MATITEPKTTFGPQAWPTRVRLHHVPNWLRLRAMGRTGASYGTAGVCVLEGAMQAAADGASGSCRWLDHWGSTTLPDGTAAFVSEPYGLSGGSMRSVLKFAELLDLNVVVQAASEWNPGSTIRIVFTPKTSHDTAQRAEAAR
jgi:hypothetical protein